MGLKSTFLSVIVVFLVIAIANTPSLNAQVREIDSENIRAREDERRIRVDGTFKELDREVRELDPDKIDVLKPDFPPFYQNLPETLLIGDFTLTVWKYTHRGQWDFASKQATGISGTAWLSFDCATYSLVPFQPGLTNVLSTFTPRVAEERYEVVNRFRVVPTVTEPQNQISLEDARMIRSDIKTGESVELKLSAKDRAPASVLLAMGMSSVIRYPRR